MERYLTWGALGIGVIGWLCTLALVRPAPGDIVDSFPAKNRSFLWLAFLLPIAIWAATLPTTPPFSAGQGWGRGFLLGSVGALATALVVLNAAHAGLPWRAARCAALFAALPVTAVPLLFMRHAVIEALAGAALGWICVVLLLAAGLQAGPRTARFVGLLANGAAFAATLCAVAALGVYRDFVMPDVGRGAYSAVALALTGSLAVALLSGALIEEIAPPRPGRLVSGVAFTVFLLVALPLGFGYLLVTRFLDDLPMLYMVGAGCALGLLLWWLVRDAVHSDASSVTRVPAAAALVALGGFIFAFQIRQGFGTGLLLLAAWPASLLALADSEEADETGAAVAQSLLALLSFLAVLVLLRFFNTRFHADLRSVTLSDQFALFGFLSGALTPAFLISLLHSRDGQEEGISLPRLLGSGVLALAIPGVLPALWGMKVAPAFFIGLALSIVSLQPARIGRQASLLALLTLAIATAMVQWAPRLLALAEASRSQRLHYLLWATGAVVALVLILEYSARLTVWLKTRRAATQGGPA